MKGDTLVVYTLSQAYQWESIYIELQGCSEEKDSLFSDIQTYRKILSTKDQLIGSLMLTNDYKDQVISSQEKMLIISSNELKREVKQKRLFKFLSGILSGAFLASLVLK